MIVPAAANLLNDWFPEGRLRPAAADLLCHFTNKNAFDGFSECRIVPSAVNLHVKKEMPSVSKQNVKQVCFRMKDDAELIGKLFEGNIESIFCAPIDGLDNDNFVPLSWLFQALKQAVDSNVDVPTVPLFKFDM